MVKPMDSKLIHDAYFQLREVVKFIHAKVYQGSADRNRYKITDDLYVWWENQMIVKIINTKANWTMEFGVLNMRVIPDQANTGNKGFYVDVVDDFKKSADMLYPQNQVEYYKAKGEDLGAVYYDLELIKTYIQSKGL